MKLLIGTFCHASLTCLINLFAIEVGQTNVFDKPFIYQGLQSRPRLDGRSVIIDYAPVRILGHQHISWLEGHWPVDEVQIHVIQLQIRERFQQ